MTYLVTSSSWCIGPASRAELRPIASPLQQWNHPSVCTWPTFVTSLVDCGTARCLWPGSVARHFFTQLGSHFFTKRPFISSKVKASFVHVKPYSSITCNGNVKTQKQRKSTQRKNIVQWTDVLHTITAFLQNIVTLTKTIRDKLKQNAYRKHFEDFSVIHCKQFLREYFVAKPFNNR